MQLVFQARYREWATRVALASFVLKSVCVARSAPTGANSSPALPPERGLGARLERLAMRAASAAGGSWAFAAAVGVVLLWLCTGPLFGFSDTWQLAINTGTTIVTFLMVFLIQRSQNKEGRALQLKLDELVAAQRGASNRLIDAEDLSEAELEGLAHHYRTLAEAARMPGGDGAQR